jgi:hypothetical protein
VSVRAEDPKPGSQRGNGAQPDTTNGISVTPSRQPNGPAATTTTDNWAYFPRNPNEVNVNTSSLQGIAGAMDFSSPTWNKEMSQTDTNLEWDNLSDSYQADVLRLAKARGGRSGSALWEKAVAISEKSVREGNPRTPFEVLNDMAGNASGGGSSGSGGSGGSGGYSGPSTSTSRTYVDRASLTDLADQISMEMIGRSVTKEEMDRIEKRVKVYERNHPDMAVSQSGVGTSASSRYDGASAAGRQDVIERIVSKNPEYGDYQKATTMMDWFDNALSERIQNG